MNSNLRPKKYDHFYSQLGRRVQQMRNLQKIHLDRMAELLGVSAKTIQRYETGETHMPPEAIGKCAKALNTPVGYFYGEGEDYSKPANSNRMGIKLAAEVMELPDDNIRKSVVQLVRTINNCWEKTSAPEG